MKMTDGNRAASVRQSLLGVGAVAALVVLLAGFGGCQSRGTRATGPTRIFLDSLRAGNEALFDSSTADLAWQRLSCVEDRAGAALGQDEALRLANEAEREVRAKHSRAEYAAGHRGLSMIHEVTNPTRCKSIDSLWYARFGVRRNTRSPSP